MSSYYGLLASEYRHYDYYEKYKRNSTTLLSTQSQYHLSVAVDEPPSYSAVLAEKYQQQQLCTPWDIRVIEINDILRSMKKSIQDTQTMVKSYQYCCQKLELKNQYFLTKLEQEIASISEINKSDTTIITSMLSNSQSDQQQASSTNDSLTRMNQSLEKLIGEAETSLNTRLSLIPPLKRTRSCPKFTAKLYSDSSLRRKSNSAISVGPDHDNDNEEKERQIQLQQQKKRYFHSQWKLAIAMKQFVQTVQNTTNQIKTEDITQSSSSSVQVVHHIHHHYHHHHVYHHYENNIANIEEIEEVESTAEIISNPLTNQNNKPALSRQEEDASPSNQANNSMTASSIPSSSSLASLFKYALHTVVGIIPQPQSHPHPQQQEPIKPVANPIVLNPVKLRSMFLATILIMQKFNKRAIWIKRGNLLFSRWTQKSKQQRQYWIQKSQVLLFVIHLATIKK